MRSGFASLAIVGVAACVAVYALTQQPSASTSAFTVMTADELEFLKYVAKFGKSYGTKEEFEFRAGQFKNTLAKLAEENSRNENTFSVAANKFADWTPAEYKRMLGYKSLNRGDRTASMIEGETAIPASVDWRISGAVNAVKDQGQCGSCWAFSAVGAMEGGWQIKSHTLLSLSEQSLVDCARGTGYLSEGCNGGEMTDGFNFANRKGMELESDYPYRGVDQSCKWDAAKVKVQTTNPAFDAVAPNSALALKTAIAKGPVSVAIEADTFVFQFYSKGILNSAACGTNLDHGVVAVGYGNDAGKEYYIVRNSWGGSWGLKGYINIAIVDGPGICGIQMDASIPRF